MNRYNVGSAIANDHINKHLLESAAGQETDRHAEVALSACVCCLDLTPYVDLIIQEIDHVYMCVPLCTFVRFE